MRETKFIEQNKEKWAEFEKQLRYGQRDPETLNRLFIEITDDLSYARTFYPNRSVRMFLNGLAQRVFHNIYKGKRFPAKRLVRFWTDELPKVMYDSRHALLLSFLIFAVSFAIGVVSSMINPDFCRLILGDSYVDETIRNINSNDPMRIYKEGGPLGSFAGIAANNLFIALQTAILGVIASIGTAFIMIYNGIMVGAFQYFFIQRGVFWDSFLSIWIHGTLEISAIIIAGAAGLVAGSGLLFPGTYRRVQAFRITMRRGLKIFLGIVPVIIIAAFFEGFLTRYTETPEIIRFLFIIASLAFVLWYFVWFPRHKALNGGFKIDRSVETPPAEYVYDIDIREIKSSGEIIADTFVVLRRHPRAVLWCMLGTTLVFLVPAFSLSDTSIASTFSFPDEPFGILKGADGFFRNEHIPYVLIFQAVLMSITSLVLFRAFEQEIGEEQRPGNPWVRNFVVGLFLIIPSLLFLLIFRWNWASGFGAWMLAMFAYPVLALSGVIMYFETANPFHVIRRMIEITSWKQSYTLGFLLVNLCVLFMVFFDLDMFMGTSIWDIVLRFFSWMVPPGDGHMAIFITVATACAASAVLYFVYALFALGGALQYFSNREVADAASMFEQIEKVGTSRRIRGLARE